MILFGQQKYRTLMGTKPQIRQASSDDARGRGRSALQLLAVQVACQPGDISQHETFNLTPVGGC